MTVTQGTECLTVNKDVGRGAGQDVGRDGQESSGQEGRVWAQWAGGPESEQDDGRIWPGFAKGLPGMKAGFGPGFPKGVLRAEGRVQGFYSRM